MFCVFNKPFCRLQEVSKLVFSLLKGPAFDTETKEKVRLNSLEVLSSAASKIFAETEDDDGNEVWTQALKELKQMLEKEPEKNPNAFLLSGLIHLVQAGTKRVGFLYFH